MTMTDQFRQTGKTTRLFEEAVALLADMPADHQVFVTAAHRNWLLELEYRFKSSGLVDIVFYSPEQISRGALSGRKGALLIDDYADMTPMQKDVVNDAQEQLERTSTNRR
jgi:hypothetical protein